MRRDGEARTILVVRWFRSVACALLFAALGCGSEDETEVAPPPPPEGCPPPGRIVGERCVEPGVQDDGCAAGTLLSTDGSCAPAGVAVPEPCASGLVALPGDTVCAPVMDCAPGTWGDLPVEANTEHVDASYMGGNSDGSAAAPWTTIAAAVGAASSGALVAVAAGTYNEDVLISSKAVRLWGVCPALVTIAGAGQQIGAVTVVRGGGSEIGGVTLTGPDTGIGVTGSLDVTIEGVVVRDSMGRGLDAEGAMGATTVTVRRSLIEGAHEFGVFIAGADVTLEGSVVRDSLPLGASFGRGVNAQQSASGESVVTMRSSVVEDSGEVGIFVGGARAEIDGVVVRDTGADGIFLGYTRGVATVATVRRTVVERAVLTGIFVGGADARVEGTVVRDTAPRPGDLLGGRGASIEHPSALPVPTNATIVGSLFERNTNIGVFVGGAATTELTGILVRDTLPNASNGQRGEGVQIENEISTAAPAVAIVSGSRIERSYEMGITVLGSEVDIVGTHVLATQPQLATSVAGRGINIQASLSNLGRSFATVTSCLSEQSHEAGVLVMGATAELDRVVVRDTRATPGGLFGDGFLVVSDLGAASATIRGSRTENSARAGLSNFSAHVALQGTILQCQSVDIAVEMTPWLEQQPTFEDQGNNRCGCPSAEAECQARGAGLTPPQPL